MQVQQNINSSYCYNNINFGRLRIRIKGDGFRNHPEDMQLIRAAIKNNEGITDFFKNHRGKITVTSKSKALEHEQEYPRCLRKVPSTPYALPFDKFTTKVQAPFIEIACRYSRAFALRNLFRKPVWINAGTKPQVGKTWKNCIDETLELIKMLGKDTPEYMAKRGDNKLRDFHSVETRKLQVEKP